MSIINNFPTFVLTRPQRICLERSEKLWDLMAQKNSKIKNILSYQICDLKITWTRLCVYIIGICTINRTRKKKDSLVKSITNIYPLAGWFKITLYNNKHAIIIVELVETMWLTMYKFITKWYTYSIFSTKIYTTKYSWVFPTILSIQAINLLSKTAYPWIEIVFLSFLCSINWYKIALFDWHDYEFLWTVLYFKFICQFLM